MVDVGKLIVLAVSLAVVGGVMTSTIFNNLTNIAGCAGCNNATGILAVIGPFIPVLFGVGVLYIAMREIGVGRK